jgi:hypothetical protein
MITFEPTIDASNAFPMLPVSTELDGVADLRSMLKARAWFPGYRWIGSLIYGKSNDGNLTLLGKVV